MRRLVALLLLACCGQAMADITMLLGPDGKPLPNGKYRLLVIPSDATQPPVNSVLDVGGTDGPAPPIVPPVIPVDTLDAKLTLLLAAVDDPAKPTTGAKLKLAYEMTLQLTASSITDTNSLRGVMMGVEKGVLDSLKKTAGWQPWVNGLADIVRPMDFEQCLATYRAAAAKLGGTAPVPPPIPPPPPVTTAASVLILMEPESPDQALSLLTNQARNDKAWSKKILILNSDAKDERKQPDPLVSKAIAHLAGRPLPRLLLLDAAGSFVADEPIPATWEATKAYLTQKGVRP